MNNKEETFESINNKIEDCYYIKQVSGGSLRHKNITIIDIRQMQRDIYLDLKQLHDQKLQNLSQRNMVKMMKEKDKEIERLKDEKRYYFNNETSELLKKISELQAENEKLKNVNKIQLTTTIRELNRIIKAFSYELKEYKNINNIKIHLALKNKTPQFKDTWIFWE